MAITFNAETENVTTGADPHTWSHTATGTPKAVVVLYTSVAVSTDIVVGVTYGGTAMTRKQTNVDAATEPGRTYIYFLGNNTNAGTQTVSVDRSDATTDAHGVCMTFDAAGDCEGVDQDGLDADRANPSVTLQYLGRTCQAVAVDYTGTASPATVGANCTLSHTHDFTAFGSATERQTTPGTADFTIAMTHASDDCAYSAFAFAQITEDAAAGTGNYRGFWG